MMPVPSVAELEAAVAAASDPSAPPSVRTSASRFLSELRTGSPDGGFGACAALLRSPSDPDDDRAAFFALSTVQSLLGKDGRTDEGGRAELRSAAAELVARLEGRLLRGVSGAGGGPAAVPGYLRTKVGIVLALLIRADFPERWPAAFDDLASFLLVPPPPGGVASAAAGPGRPAAPPSPSPSPSGPSLREDLYLRALHGLIDEVVDCPRGSSASGSGSGSPDRDALVKDAMRGLVPPPGGGAAAAGAPGVAVAAIPANETVSAELVDVALGLVGKYRRWRPAAAEEGAAAAEAEAEAAGELARSALSLLSRLASWIDLSLLLDRGRAVVPLLYSVLSDATGGEDPTPQSALAVQSVETLREMAGRGMEPDRKVALVAELDLFRNLERSGVDLTTVDGTHIDVVIKLAELVNGTGMELLEARGAFPASGGGGGGGGDGVDGMSSDEREEGGRTLNALLRQMADVFFRCLDYDDIDVSGAVLPLAGRLVASASPGREPVAEDAVDAGDDAPFRPSDHLPRLLSVLFRRMRYPPDFAFDPEDDEGAEEERYRSDLRRLHREVVRADPPAALRFLRDALSSLPAPLSSCPFPELEACLRLVFHHCEGLRPPPGMKTALKDPLFCEFLVGLHSSDVASHPHGEVLTLYYDVAARYHPLLRDRPDLLERVLGAVSGPGGLTHPHHPRVRSRSCYLLLRMVGSLGTALRPYAKTAAGGIQRLLDDPTLGPLLSDDDRLRLFETTGLLLGRTGMGPAEQGTYLTAVMTPHVQSIRTILGSPEMRGDPDRCGEVLSSRVAAITCLSKGFKRPLCPEASTVLAGAIPVVLAVLTSLPSDPRVRSRSAAFLQRAIHVLDGDVVVPSVPPFLDVLVRHCDVEDAVDVQTILQQLVSRYRADAAPSIDAALAPFLRRCRGFVPGGGSEEGESATAADADGGGDDDAPAHLAAERLEIRKLSLGVLQQIVRHGAENVFLTPTNVPHLPDVLDIAKEGAVSVDEDLTVRRASMRFFRGLIERWGPDPSPPDDGGGGRAVDPAVRSGFLRYVYDSLLPSLLSSFLHPSFDTRDALGARAVSEAGNVLWSVRDARGPAEFEAEVAGRVSSPLRAGGCSPAAVAALADGLHRAGDGREMAERIGEMIAAARAAAAMRAGRR